MCRKARETLWKIQTDPFNAEYALEELRNYCIERGCNYSFCGEYQACLEEFENIKKEFLKDLKNKLL